MDDIQARQRDHYDRIAQEYEAHYSDSWTQKYRDKFISGR
jgi:hypothetical protein